MNSSLFTMKLETSKFRPPFCTFYTVYFSLALLKMINTNGKYLVHFFYLNRIFYQKGRATSKDHFSAWIVGFVALEVPHLFLYRSLCKRFDICFRILLFILCLLYIISHILFSSFFSLLQLVQKRFALLSGKRTRKFMP